MSNPGEPPGFDQSIDAGWELQHMKAAIRRLPLLGAARVVSRLAGLYEVTPGAHPILGGTPVGGFYLVTGFSGDGFMHGPICGLLLAEVVLDGQASTLDISSLALSRFGGQGAPTAEYNVV